MLRFFKRTKTEKWEIELLNTVLNLLPEPYTKIFKSQIEQDLLKGVLIDMSDIPGYVAFTFHPDVYKRFYDKKGRNFQFRDIFVFDLISSEFVNYEIYISSGVINGYRINKYSKFKIDLNRVDVSKFKKSYLYTNEFSQISNILTDEEKEKINPDEVFSLNFNDIIYYHIQDLEDGDFLAIDKNKVVYKFTQDPFEAEVINNSLLDII